VLSESPADGSLRSEELLTSPISISGRDLHRGRGVLLLEPSSGRHSQAILDPTSVIQNMYLDDTDKGREAFSEIKSIVRKAGARTREALDEAISQAISAITLEDVAGWFSHCGYEPRDQYS
jgi:hypothetical protein